MKKSYTCKIGGQAGFGIVTSGLILSKTARRCGYYLFDYFEYPSLIRGGHNVTETHFGADPVFSQEEKVDVLVALNRETFDFHKTEIKCGGGVVFDPDQCAVSAEELPDGAQLFPVPLTKIIQDAGGSKVMENNVALGAAAGLFSFDKETLMGVIRDAFAGKKDEVASLNQQIATSGYEYVKSHQYVLKTMSAADAVPTPTPDAFAILTGNEAMAFGAIAGNCKFYAAYPMTPSSTVLHMLAQYALTTGMVVRHAEDEIAVINEAIGASFAGVRSMVGTSGGGFALMAESISLAGITERGLVILLSQRPGPATGMPTWTEQGDLLFAVNAGHGEFPKIVLAAGDVADAFYLTFKAHNLADRYQTPVIIMSDKYLGESHQDVDKNKLLAHSMPIDVGKWETILSSNQPPAAFPRYQSTDDGISSRVRPGTPGYFYQENSYEHAVDGHTTEQAKERKEQVDKRQRKMTTYLAHDFEGPKLYGDPNSDLTLIGWGSVKNPILEAVVNRSDELKRSVNYLHFTHLWPMDDKKVSKLLAECKNTALVENNSRAQFGQLLRMVTGYDIAKRLLKYDGRPFYPDEIVTFINTI